MISNDVEIVEVLNRSIETVRLSKCDITIDSNAAGVIYGIRDSVDVVDVLLPERMFDGLKVNHTVGVEPRIGMVAERPYFECEGVRYYRSADYSLLYNPNLKDRLFGYPVVPKFQILADRLRQGRPEDMSDIRALRRLWQDLPPGYKDRLIHLLDSGVG